MRLRALTVDVQYRLLVLAGLVMVCGLYWDAWWHVTYGRHSFWIAPHLAIYSGVSATAALTALGWYEQRRGRRLPGGYRLLSLAVVLTLLAAPFDDLWHRFFGEEALTSLLALWSPPHLLALLSAVIGGLGAFTAMAADGGKRRFPGLMIVEAAIVSAFGAFVLLPFDPSGFYRVAGVAGPAVIAFLAVAWRSLALGVIRLPGTVTGINTIVTILLLLFLTHRHRGPLALIAHHPPAWAVVIGLIGAAGCVDLLAWRNGAGLSHRRTLGRWGMVYAAVHGLIFYPAANAAARAGWTAFEVAVMIAGAVVAGYAGGWSGRWAADQVGVEELPGARPMAAPLPIAGWR